MREFKGLWRALLLVCVPVSLLVIGRYTGSIPGKNYSYSLYPFENNRAIATSGQNPLLMERNGIFPGIEEIDPSTFGKFANRMPGFVALCDLDNDGFDDLISITNRPRSFGVVHIYRNLGGKGFSDITEKSGFRHESPKEFRTVVACADFDNDGWSDLAFGGIGQYLQIYKNDRGKLSLWSSIESFAETRAINVFDANGDGYLDIIAGNYRILERDVTFGHTLQINPYRNNEGGQDKIYLNEGGSGRFRELPASHFSESGVTWAIGVSDFNGDSHPDIFVAHDFGLDSYFEGTPEGVFRDATKTRFPRLRSRNSISAEVVDLNDDGLPDFYVSNRPKTGNPKGFNSMWMNQPEEPGSFRDRAADLNIDRCGWSWGAKFSDLDQDGHLDLMVVNGLFGVGESYYWYPSEYYLSIPFALRKWVPFKHNHGASISATPRKCVFMGKPGGGFLALSPEESGFSDRKIARGLALSDFDLDGDEDVFVGRPHEGPVLYENRSPGGGRWLAVRLTGTKSNARGIGSRLIVRTNQRQIRRDYYPLNGYQSQSGSYIFFTFREGESPDSLEIFWPKGGTSKVENPKIGRHLRVREP